MVTVAGAFNVFLTLSSSPFRYQDRAAVATSYQPRVAVNYPPAPCPNVWFWTLFKQKLRLLLCLFIYYRRQKILMTVAFLIGHFPLILYNKTWHNYNKEVKWKEKEGVKMRQNCHDNALCESMWARMKEELFYLRDHKPENYTIDELNNLIWRYFMSYWNNRRICSVIGGVPPAVKRRNYYAALNAVA